MNGVWLIPYAFHSIRLNIKIFFTQIADAKTVGVEFDFVHLDNYRKFSYALPNAKFVDVSQPTMKMRMLKSPEEIGLIKQGARIADLGGEAAVKVIKEGVGEHEIALASTDSMVRAIADTYPHSEIRDSKFHFLFHYWNTNNTSIRPKVEIPNSINSNSV